jgi:excisionase family DNA binding protein
MTVYRLIERGGIPAHRIGAQLRVRPSDLAAYLAAVRIEVAP